MDVIKAQSILIIPKQSYDLDIWLSAVSLGMILIEQGKTVHYFVDEVHQNNFLEIIKDKELFHGQMGKNKLVVKLERVESIITDLDWSQKNASVEIILSSKNDSIGTPDISVTHYQQSYALRIFVGLNKSEAENISKLSDSGLDSGTSVYLSRLSDNIISIVVYRFIKQTKYRITHKSSKLLLESMRNSTQDFTISVTPETFTIAADLLKAQVTSGLQVQKQKSIKQKEALENNEKPVVKDIPKPTIASKEETKQADTLDENFAIPEELPSDYDPLSPALNIPKPIKLGGNEEAPKPQVNTPLPEAS